MSKYRVAWTTRFKKDYKIAQKRGKDMNAIRNVIRQLASGESLPESMRDHELSGNWVGHRECHIEPDWLLAYRVEEDILVLTLTRTGSHSDLF